MCLHDWLFVIISVGVGAQGKLRWLVGVEASAVVTGLN